MQPAADAARRHSGAEASTAAGGSGSGAADAAPAPAHRRIRSDESLDEWFDASSDLEEALLEAQLEVAVPPSPITVAPHVGSSGPPTPCEPADADDWLPPHAASPQTRAAAVAALRTAILATPDAAAVATWEDRSPATLERFLRARDFDVPVATTLFLEHRAWRCSIGWHVTGTQVNAAQLAERKIALQALSRTGAPWLIIVAKRHDSAARDMTDVRTYIVYTMDKIMDALRPGEQFVVCVDFKGMTRRNIDVKALLACFEILQKFYVERVQHLWFASPPAIFWGIWKMVTPFVAPKTREKIVFLYDKEIPATMQKHFDAADIPAEYGGTGELRPVTAGPAPWEAPGAPRRRRY